MPGEKSTRELGSQAEAGKTFEKPVPNLLALLNSQLPADLDALDRVGEEVSGGILQLVLVEGSRQVPAQEDNGVGQQLGAKAGSAFSGLRRAHPSTKSPQPSLAGTFLVQAGKLRHRQLLSPSESS